MIAGEGTLRKAGHVAGVTIHQHEGAGRNSQAYCAMEIFAKNFRQIVPIPGTSALVQREIVAAVEGYLVGKKMEPAASAAIVRS